MRLHHQLEERVERGDAHEEPVARDEEYPRQEVVLLAFHARNEVEIDVEEVSEEQADRAQVQNGAGEQHVVDVHHCLTEDDVQSQQDPHQGVEEQHGHAAAYHELKGEQVVQAPLAKVFNGVPHVHQVGLHVPLDPARALSQPVLQLRVCLLERRRVEDDRIHAVALQAQAEVAILGHVVGVPTAQGPQGPRAKMVRRPPQGQGEVRQLQPRQNQVEPGGILSSKPAREQVLTNIVKVELGLHADHVGSVIGEREHRLLQLQGVGYILRIVDDDVVAPGQHQSVITRARLGAGFAIWHNHDLEVRREGQGTDGVARGGIVLFGEEKDLQFLGRVVQCRHGLHELRHDLRLLVERAQNGVLGPLRVSQRVNDIVADMFLRRIPERARGQAEIDEQAHEIHDGDSRNHRRQKFQPEEQYARNPEQADEREGDDLSGRECLQGGQLRSKRGKNGDLVLADLDDLGRLLNIVVDLFGVIVPPVMLGLLFKPRGVKFHPLLIMDARNQRGRSHAGTARRVCNGHVLRRSCDEGREPHLTQGLCRRLHRSGPIQ